MSCDWKTSSWTHFAERFGNPLNCGARNMPVMVPEDKL
jgi:hypothetical protein